MENITGKAFPELVEESLFKPLGLTGSSWTVPKDNSSGVVLDATVWNLDFGDETPYAPPSLSYSRLLTKSQSRRHVQYPQRPDRHLPLNPLIVPPHTRTDEKMDEASLLHFRT